MLCDVDPSIQEQVESSLITGWCFPGFAAWVIFVGAGSPIGAFELFLFPFGLLEGKGALLGMINPSDYSFLKRLQTTKQIMVFLLGDIVVLQITLDFSLFQ